MKITYQPIVKEKAREVLNVIEETGFFEANGVENTEYAYNRLCKLLTEQFISGEIQDGPYFTIPEMDRLLNEIVAEDTLNKLMERGLVGFFEDEDDEKSFYFLTEEGKKLGIAMGLDKIPPTDEQESEKN